MNQPQPQPPLPGNLGGSPPGPAAQASPATRSYGSYPPDRGPDDADTGLWALRVARMIVVFVYAVVIAGLVLLVIGFALQLFGASTDADFTRWVYRNVDRIMEPFRGMFPSPTINDRSVVDFSLLFAMIVYAIVALALHALVTWLAGHITQATRARERSRARAPRPMADPY